MSHRQLHVLSPELLADFVRNDPLRGALQQIAGMAGAELNVSAAAEKPQIQCDSASVAESPILYNGRCSGRILYDQNSSGDIDMSLPGSHTAMPAVSQAASAVRGVLEHLLDREAAVADLADALFTSYEELNMLYTLLPDIATHVSPRQVGELLVEKAAQMLHCGRVSLLVLDEKRENLSVLASHGLPRELESIRIPVVGSVAEYAMLEDLLVINDAEQRPELNGRSKGVYSGTAYAVARVPLRAQGQAVGVLAATERYGSEEFTARDRKLLEGFSAMGASAILNCRLHAAVNRQMMSTIQALACAVDAKDQYTHDHSGRVSRLCVATARALGVKDEEMCREIELSGLLHDIGKIGIPDAILSKPDRLTPHEFAVVKTHVSIGASIVGKVPGLERVANAILHHHERFDGLGYPEKLAGEQIPLASKLIAVSDTYDSLTSDRAYRKATTRDNGLRKLHRCRAMQFDPSIVDAFTSLISAQDIT